MALRPDGRIVIVEVKSGLRDFASDAKWPEYRAFCDALLFAVDPSFPLARLPPGPGILLADPAGSVILREPEPHPLAPARRRALTHRFATLAALRLAAFTDPAPDGRFPTRAD